MPNRSKNTKGSGKSRPIRVIIAKPGLDGHDRGAKVVARALRDAGMEVIYLGLRQTPESIVDAAIEEDADVIGLSLLSGAHMTLVPRVVKILKDRKVRGISVFAGGIIPDEDARRLRSMGIKAIFGPGATLESIIHQVRQTAGRHAA
ncbi:MAG: cobalamin B12-binding domain-containing protein [Candidatus Thermoplasmatota archaeon]|nr:cobalamin B12-binding domain-containing protein [Candidatus Thermoplasmatota archaeon]MCL5984799.1 cobalamin B12-binding domain-containing protein [Candidatus Thermoplasmatota archaeon]